MKKIILFMFFISLLFVMPMTYAISSLEITSYWGTVYENGIPKQNFQIAVLNASGKVIASTDSRLDSPKGSYQVSVPWDNLATTDKVEGVVSGETITFKVNGTTVISRVIDAIGTNNQLNLSITTATPTPVRTSPGTTAAPTQTSGTKTGPGESKSTPKVTAVPIVTQTQTVTQTPTSVETIIETPEQTSTPEPVSTASRETPGTGFIVIISVLVFVTLFLKKYK